MITKTSTCKRCFCEFQYTLKRGRRVYCDSCQLIIKKIHKKKERERWRLTPAGKLQRKRLRERLRPQGLSKGNREAQSKRMRDELRVSYLKNLITYSTGLPLNLITKKLIQLKREQLHILRFYRKARKELAL